MAAVTPIPCRVTNKLGSACFKTLHYIHCGRLCAHVCVRECMCVQLFVSKYLFKDTYDFSVCLYSPYVCSFVFLSVRLTVCRWLSDIILQRRSFTMVTRKA